MSDKRIKFDCPFCGESKENIRIKVYGQNPNQLVYIYCPVCEAEFKRANKMEAINAWNRRFL